MNLRHGLILLLALLSLTTLLPAQIKSGTAIQITISGVPPEEKGRFDQVYPVSDTGMINMPFLGLIRVSGMRAESLAVTLQKLYSEAEIYTNATFQVIEKASSGTVEEELITVGGYVRAPGQKPYIRNMTLWQAVQAAGGATEFGSMNRVQLTRGGSSKEYDLNKPENKQIRVQPGDSIDVPQKNWLGQ